MASAAAPVSAAPRSQWRFSLGGMMFTFFLGLSVGLSYWRWRDVTFFGAMLLSFTIWLLIGLIQRLQRDVSQLDRLGGAALEARWGYVFRLAVSIWCVFLFAIVAACELARRYDVLASGWPLWLADVLFFWQSSAPIGSRHWSANRKLNRRASWGRLVRRFY